MAVTHTASVEGVGVLCGCGRRFRTAVGWRQHVVEVGAVPRVIRRRGRDSAGRSEGVKINRGHKR